MLCWGRLVRSPHTRVATTALKYSKWFISLCLHSGLILSTDMLTTFSIDSTPTLQAVKKLIVREVAADWSAVAIHLGLDYSVIRMAETDHPRHCERSCTDMFNRWLSLEQETGERGGLLGLDSSVIRIVPSWSMEDTERLKSRQVPSPVNISSIQFVHTSTELNLQNINCMFITLIV